MNPGSIEGANAVMGAPKGMEDEVIGLPIIRTDEGWQISRWDPTPEERSAIHKGAYVRLWVMGPHPVISIDTAGALTATSTVAMLQRQLNAEREKVALLRQAVLRMGQSGTGLLNIADIALDATK